MLDNTARKRPMPVQLNRRTRMPGALDNTNTDCGFSLLADSVSLIVVESRMR